MSKIVFIIGASAVQISSDIADYNPVREAFAETGDNPDTWGKPEATVEPVLNLIDNQNPPQRLLFGKTAYHVVNEVYTKRLDEIQNWKEVSIAAHGH